MKKQLDNNILYHIPHRHLEYLIEMLEGRNTKLYSWPFYSTAYCINMAEQTLSTTLQIFVLNPLVPEITIHIFSIAMLLK